MAPDGRSHLCHNYTCQSTDLWGTVPAMSHFSVGARGHPLAGGQCPWPAPGSSHQGCNKSHHLIIQLKSDFQIYGCAHLRNELSSDYLGIACSKLDTVYGNSFHNNQLLRGQTILSSAASWLPILFSHIGSQVKRRQSQSYKFKISKLKQTLHATHLL